MSSSPIARALWLAIDEEGIKRIILMNFRSFEDTLYPFSVPFLKLLCSLLC